MEMKYFLKSDKYEIPAVLHLPECVDPVPAVILCHGTSAEKDEAYGLFVYLAKALAEKGIASMRLDFAGCGESKAKPTDFSFCGEVDDVEKVYAFLCQQKQIDPKQIGILGLSQGGRVMAEFVGRHPSEISAAVSWSGTCHKGEGIYANWFHKHYEEARRQGYAQISWGWQDNLTLTKEWFEEIQSTDPMESLARFEGHLLAFGGTKDAIVPWKHAIEIASVCKFGEYQIVENGDHILNVKEVDKTVSAGVVEATAKWFANYLK